MSGQSTLSVSFGHMRVISFSFGDTRVKMQGSSNFAVLDIRALSCSSARSVPKSVVSRGAGRIDPAGFVILQSARVSPADPCRSIQFFTISRMAPQQWNLVSVPGGGWNRRRPLAHSPQTVRGPPATVPTAGSGVPINMVCWPLTVHRDGPLALWTKSGSSPLPLE